VIHVFKPDGPYLYDKKPYSIKAINPSELDKYRKDGWVRSIDEALGVNKNAKPQKAKKSKEAVSENQEPLEEAVASDKE
jgi:hypothetical protein